MSKYTTFTAMDFHVTGLHCSARDTCALSGIMYVPFPPSLCLATPVALICTMNSLLVLKTSFKIRMRTCYQLCGLAGTQAPFSYAPVRGLRASPKALQHACEEEDTTARCHDIYQKCQTRGLLARPCEIMSLVEFSRQSGL